MTGLRLWNRNSSSRGALTSGDVVTIIRDVSNVALKMVSHSVPENDWLPEAWDVLDKAVKQKQKCKASAAAKIAHEINDSI